MSSHLFCPSYCRGDGIVLVGVHAASAVFPSLRAVLVISAVGLAIHRRQRCSHGILSSCRTLPLPL